MRNQIRLELTEAGKSRKAEMLSDIQDSMIDYHRTKRQKRKRLLHAAAVCIPLLVIGIWITATHRSNDNPNNLSLGSFNTNVERVSNPSEAEKRNLENENTNANSLASEQHSDETLPTGNHSTNNQSLSRNKQFVVQNNDVSHREMELIDDDQLLELLKQVGVDAWLAEINDERIVLTQSGKRL